MCAPYLVAVIADNSGLMQYAWNCTVSLSFLTSFVNMHAHCADNKQNAILNNGHIEPFTWHKTLNSKNGERENTQTKRYLPFHSRHFHLRDSILLHICLACICIMEWLGEDGVRRWRWLSGHSSVQQSRAQNVNTSWFWIFCYLNGFFSVSEPVQFVHTHNVFEWRVGMS